MARGAGGGGLVLLLDSITEIVPGDAGAVVVTGSHGGATATAYAAAVPLRACFFNDAGIGKDEAGISGLAALPYPAGAYSHETARIGDAADGWSTGILSAVNMPARQVGLRVGQRVADAVSLLRGSAG